MTDALRSPGRVVMIPKDEHWRVRVEIKDRDRWAVGAADAFDGMTGTVVAFNDKSFSGEPLFTRAELVVFDEPVVWGIHRSEGFWFPPAELVRL